MFRNSFTLSVRLASLTFFSIAISILASSFNIPIEQKSALNADIKSDWPKPSYYVKDIPVYNKFADIEAAFQQNNDTTYIINFWATWCAPCIAELPYFEELTEKYKDSKVKVILCSLDFPKQIETKLVSFVEKKGLKSEVVVLLDGKYNDWIDKVSPDWSGAIPATYVYNRENNSFFGEPFENLQELEEAIKPLL
ncbi:TlpA family protein disulfide reductase [Chondrinema litorale]|uniref:TlpA family protein disulfide reductase n=1 Tax=Chondrinema litorale TaxID=2994555 RepID=UPI0025435A03|nr:TlpA family protein disulfide reductase [Chondrinema litorale]UZR97610.1 TlpA family protein disulfide reductase [Chondrinema litorale]